jgi:hypothetical protein
MANEDWGVLTGFFPSQWRELAVQTNALKGLRKQKDPENLLRTLMIHLGSGCSLRETVVRSRLAGIADLSDVALLKRLRKSKDWLRALCQAMLVKRGIELDGHDGFQVRLFDATNVKEPGKTGSLWRVHYSLRIPSLLCDSFRITETSGAGCGESFRQFSVKAGDYIIADRGYSSARGMEYIASQGAYAIVRLNPHAVRLETMSGKAFDLLKKLKTGMSRAGNIKSWQACACDSDGGTAQGRICAIRKSREAIEIAHKKLRRRASKKGHVLKPETLEYAKYVIVLTTFPREKFPASAVLEWYRVRWQVELVFKRFKQIAQMGHLPKHDDESAKAWLYGKLFVALLTEGLIECAGSISPWGYFVDSASNPKPLARVRVCSAPSATRG